MKNEPTLEQMIAVLNPLHSLKSKKTMKEGITIEQMIAVIMAMKNLLGEFSVDMYYNDLAESNERYVVKLSVSAPNPNFPNNAEYFRYGNFKEGLYQLLESLIYRV